jgi:fatty acid desaturase
MLLRQGISGGQRVARHLWRMCFALFIAAASIFLARQQLFPGLLRKTGVLFLLSLLPLLLMIFWLVRVLFTRAFNEQVFSGDLASRPGLQSR